MKVYLGEIVDFRGTWGSGIGYLCFKDGRDVPCENAPTVRALDSAFGDVITGHSVDLDALVGKEIIWWHGDMGMMMGGFIPADLWDGPEIPEGGLELSEDELSSSLLM